MLLRKGLAIMLKWMHLFRGEIFRWGLKSPEFQWDVFDAMQRNVINPLESCNHTVDLYWAINTRQVIDDILLNRMAQIYRAHMFYVQSFNQTDNFQQVLKKIEMKLHSYDVVLIARYDTKVIKPFHEWGCYRNWWESRCMIFKKEIYFPGFTMEDGHRLVINDLYHIFPASKKPIIDQVFFQDLIPSCFRDQKTSGHMCFLTTVKHTDYIPRLCKNTIRNRVHSPNFNTHSLPRCDDMNSTGVKLPWRCVGK